MATKHGSKLSGKLGDEIHYIVKGTERVRRRPKHVNQPGTKSQKKHWGDFIDIVRLSSHMTEAYQIGLHYSASRRHTYPYLLFRSINNDCFTPDGSIDYPRVILSQGSVERVSITSVKTRTSKKTTSRTVTITFNPCLQHGNAWPDDELYLYAYCPARCEGALYEPVPRIAGKVTVLLPDEWQQATPDVTALRAKAPSPSLSHNQTAEVHLYAFLRCPGPTADTPASARTSAENHRGQTSSTIYIPLT